MTPTIAPTPKMGADTSDSSDDDGGANNDYSTGEVKREGRTKRKLARLIELIKCSHSN